MYSSVYYYYHRMPDYAHCRCYDKFHYFIQKLTRIGSITDVVNVADQAQFEVLPPEVGPNSQFTIVGSFYDSKGKPQTVKNGYYFVFLDQNLLVQGSIGQNVSAF